MIYFGNHLRSAANYRSTPIPTPVADAKPLASAEPIKTPQVIEPNKTAPKTAPDYTATKIDQFIQKYRIPIIAAIWILALTVAALTAYAIGGPHPSQDAIGIAFLPLLGIPLTGHLILHSLGENAEKRKKLNEEHTAAEQRSQIPANHDQEIVLKKAANDRLLARQNSEKYRLQLEAASKKRPQTPGSLKEREAILEIYKDSNGNRKEFKRLLEEKRISAKKLTLINQENSAFEKPISARSQYWALRSFDDCIGARPHFHRTIDLLVDQGRLSVTDAEKILKLADQYEGKSEHTSHQFDQWLIPIFETSVKKFDFQSVVASYEKCLATERNPPEVFTALDSMNIQADEIQLVRWLFISANNREEFIELLNLKDLNISKENQYLYLKIYDSLNFSRSNRELGIDLLVEDQLLTPAQAQNEILVVDGSKTTYYEGIFSACFTVEQIVEDEHDRDRLIERLLKIDGFSIERQYLALRNFDTKRDCRPDYAKALDEKVDAKTITRKSAQTEILLNWAEAGQQTPQ